MNWNFVIFFSIVILVYLSINFYIFIRGLQAIPIDSPIRIYYMGIFTILSLSFWFGRITEKFYPSVITDIAVWIGSFWLAFILYFFLTVLLLDILRALNHFLHFIPQSFYVDYSKTKLIIFTTVIVLVTGTVFAGFINFLNPNIRKMELNIDKKAGNIKKLNIVVASDIHMGTIVSNGRVKKIVDMINSLNPDLVLLPGDILDEDLEPVIRKNLGDDIKKIESKYGVIAVNGNHEFIGGVEAADKYLRNHGIILLRDSVITVNNEIVIVGREDRSINRIKERKTLETLLSGFDSGKPIIMMDHQPFKLHEAQKAGIDLQLSGHTHHGQLFPFNFLTSLIYELSWGYKKKGNTHYYVSSGISGWGPPVRLGSRTELVNIVLNFK